jgi:proteasome assembly chaperone (PAC2) family protein
MIEKDLSIPYIQWAYTPELKAPFFVVGFYGWSNAGSIAGDTIMHAVTALEAKPFAVLDQEPFLHFTSDRPGARIEDGLIVEMETTSAELSYYRNTRGDHDLIFLLGKEPQVFWSEYSLTIMKICQKFSAAKLITLGGVQDTVSHTDRPLISVVGSCTEEVRTFREFGPGIRPAAYSGPVGIHSKLILEAVRQGLPAVSLWAHVPAYLQKSPRLAAKLITILNVASGASCSIEDLIQRSVELDRRIDEALTGDPDLKQFVETIEGKKVPKPSTKGEKVIRLEDCRRKDFPKTPDH